MSESLDFDEILAEENGPPTSQCATCRMLDELDDIGDPNASKVRRALGSKSVSTAAIHRAVRRLGYKISDDAIRNHRTAHMGTV